MQSFLLKYGVAAHLAFLAVAPLFLSFTSVLWLAGLGIVWVLFEPSRIGNESLHRARARVAHNVVRDPVFWCTLVLALFAALRWINGGVGMAYDSEHLAWSISEPKFPYLPGSVTGAFGAEQFAFACAALVILQGCRHAMGRMSRFLFLILASSFSGLYAIGLASSLFFDGTYAKELLECSMLSPAFIGVTFGVFLLMATAALISVFEYRLRIALFLMIFAIGGNAAGLLLFSPVWAIVLFVPLTFIVLVYSFIYGLFRFKSATDKFKYIVIFGMSFAMGVALTYFDLSTEELEKREDAIVEGQLFSEKDIETHNVLSAFSQRIWKTSPWIGTGIGSFPLELRFNASEDEWLVINTQQKAPYSAYWLSLVERGVVGLVLLVALFVLPSIMYVRKLIKGILVAIPHPACWAGLLAVLAIFAEAFVDCSMLMPGTLLAALSLYAVAAKSFPKEMKHGK